PPSSMVRITRSSQAGEQVQLIQDAFAAYQSGDFAQSQLKYSEALEQYPDSRDAMLGMAAVALQTGRQQQAINYYLQLLNKNPLDNIARAAILGQQRGNNSLESISQLKSMIYDAPDQPYLYFAVGKLHVSRGNWSEAQQAFFDAHRLDTTNPDFALNLAISLDRLGQSQTALDYYNVALSLAENNPASFQSSVVQSRIDTLTRGN
ncbi:MAG: tetratricopeptide repeat protein, partial [Gammaproteobacteria bacterium]|nr:tetratricopeptide repeat protein [Gammaproteobacteria bacterium]